jgi:hypothetical protein
MYLIGVGFVGFDLKVIVTGPTYVKDPALTEPPMVVITIGTTRADDEVGIVKVIDVDVLLVRVTADPSTVIVALSRFEPLIVT